VSEAGGPVSAEDDRDRAVIDERDLHALPERAGCDRDTLRRKGGTETLAQRARDLGASCPREAGSIAPGRIG